MTSCLKVDFNRDEQAIIALLARIADRFSPQQWSEADRIWEYRQSKANAAFQDGRLSDAISDWDRALQIARAHFGRGDPRIATSWTNHAFGLRHQKLIHQADVNFKDALAKWDQSWCWISLMQIDPLVRGTARATLFRALFGIAGLGKSATLCLQRGDPVPFDGCKLWSQAALCSFSDLRALTAAVLLVTSDGAVGPGGRSIESRAAARCE